MATPFADILRDVVERTPRAVGGAFAAPDGEMVEYFSEQDPEEWALLTAYYGVVLGHLEAAFNTWHFGGPQFFFVEHSKIDVLVHTVDRGYYAVLAIEQPAPLWTALAHLTDAVAQLRKEMHA